jgi:hypothetical protein
VSGTHPLRSYTPSNRIQGIDQGIIGVRQQVPIDIEDCSDARMASTPRNFLGIGSRRNPQRDGRVPKIMHANVIESSRLDRRQPYSCPESRPAEQTTIRAWEHERVCLSLA